MEYSDSLNFENQVHEKAVAWSAITSGKWFWKRVRKSFVKYWDAADLEYLEAIYGTKNKTKISKRLIADTAKKSALLGGMIGAVISSDEVIGIVTVGEGIVGLPINFCIAALAIAVEVIALMKLQLQLVCNLSKLYGVSLDPDDPADVLTIVAIALGSLGPSNANIYFKKIDGEMANRMATSVFNIERLTRFKLLAGKMRIKLLQRSVFKYAIPVISIIFGGGSNYRSSRKVGKVAVKHLKQITEKA